MCFLPRITTFSSSNRWFYDNRVHWWLVLYLRKGKMHELTFTKFWFLIHLVCQKLNHTWSSYELNFLCPNMIHFHSLNLLILIKLTTTFCNRKTKLKTSFCISVNYVYLSIIGNLALIKISIRNTPIACHSFAVEILYIRIERSKSNKDILILVCSGKCCSW